MFSYFFNLIFLEILVKYYYFRSYNIVNLYKRMLVKIKIYFDLINYKREFLIV